MTTTALAEGFTSEEASALCGSDWKTAQNGLMNGSIPGWHVGAAVRVAGRRTVPLN